jgi:hypothetical protein
MTGLLAPAAEISIEIKQSKAMDSMDAEGDSCPVATHDVEVNLKCRQKAIDKAMYGPMNPNEPNNDYWRKLAEGWRLSAGQAKKSTCGNCAAFIQTSKMLDCIDKGLGKDSDAWDVIDAGDLGYCEVWDFKCAAKRTCSAWIVGGPITDDSGEGEES